MTPSASFSVPPELERTLREIAASDGLVVVLTGAGISQESGIPTFRGRDGYWTVGSTEYHPQEMATYAMFSQEPDEVWAWYLYRRGVCLQAQPNAGHLAVVALEQRLGTRFVLITQNVDGLHLRAGSSRERTYEIHGNIHFARCAADCGAPLFELPASVADRPKGAPLTTLEREVLTCTCGARRRPHVLWFDECYDEAHFRFNSSIAAAARAALLIVVGTSGATNLPMQVGQLALARGAAIVDINPEPNPFSELAQAATRGHYLASPSGTALPALAALFE